MKEIHCFEMPAPKGLTRNQIWYIEAVVAATVVIAVVSGITYLAILINSVLREDVSILWRVAYLSAVVMIAFIECLYLMSFLSRGIRGLCLIIPIIRDYISSVWSGDLQFMQTLLTAEPSTEKSAA